MASDWIKMRMDLHRHPKVVRIVSAFNADKNRTESGQASAKCPQSVRECVDSLRVIGGLHAVWCLFDQYSEDGQLPGYTPEILDRTIGWDGFSRALIDVGWLTYEDGQGIGMPRFESHNGQSAKRRASEAERKKNERAQRPQSVRKVSACDADKKRTREEKRREEEKNTQRAPAVADALPGLEAEPKQDRQRNPQFDALAAIDGLGETINSREAGRIGKALKIIRESSPEVTPEEIQTRAQAYRRKYQNAALTAQALASHWNEFSQAEDIDDAKGILYAGQKLSSLYA